MASPIRVLVVDDEVDFAEALVSRLATRGFAARAAFSGPDAIDQLRASTFDVVVLDLKMPDMDGLATLRELQRLDPDLQTIILTGHGTVASGIEGMQLGATDFLQKPVDIEPLCTVLVAASQRTAELREAAASKRGVM